MDLKKRSHVAERTCLVCRQKKARVEFIRLAIDPENGLIIPDKGKIMVGRGGHVCRECLPRLTFNKRVQRAFRNRGKGLSPEII